MFETTFVSIVPQGLQTELDKSSAQVRALENQKAEAQKRLDDLDQQKTKLEGLLAEVQVQCQEVQKSVDSLRGQISTQQTTVKVRLSIPLNDILFCVQFTVLSNKY